MVRGFIEKGPFFDRVEFRGPKGYIPEIVINKYESWYPGKLVFILFFNGSLLFSLLWCIYYTKFLKLILTAKN